MSALSWKDRSDLLIKIGRMEMRMRSDGQERPLWRGPVPEVDLLGSTVVVPTEQGERRGRVICFGVVRMPDGIDYERSVVVHVPSSGTHHEAPGSLTRLASPEDAERIQGEMEMARKLSELTEGRTGATPIDAPKKPRKRGERDPKLVERMLEAARSSNRVKSLDEAGTNWKITGIDSSKRLYVFKTQLRVDISGFTLDHAGVRKISDDEARDMHLGKVRGQLIFDDKETAFAGFQAALEMLG
ncbi:MAG: hypothetical protein AB7V46_11790 [Thermomicrobiales bacterium]